MTTKDELVIKTNEIAQLKNMGGWKFFEEYLVKEQASIYVGMAKCGEDGLRVYQGRLKELINIRKWLKMELVSAENMISQIEEKESDALY